MPRLLRSRFPVAPDRPTARQLELFSGERRTPSTRRWSEVEAPPAIEDTAVIDQQVTVAADDAHRSRESQLTRPRHRAAKQRAVGRGIDLAGWSELTNETIDPEGASCGRSAEVEDTGAEAQVAEGTSVLGAPASGFDVPDPNRNEGVTQQRDHFAPVDVRTSGIRVAPMSSGVVQAPRAISLSPAQPEWSCATAWLRSVEAKGGGSGQSVTAVASYAFVAAMIACTFLV